METATRLLCLLALTIFSADATPSDEDGRIVNGMMIRIEQAPYMVRMEHASGAYCGGTLIAPNYVLTAAHCVDGMDPKSINIYANVSTIYEERIRRTVTKCVMHPEYTAITMHSDAAVCELNEPIKGMTYLKLCDQPLKENDMVQVSGWGRPAMNERGNTQLHTVLLPVRSQATCSLQHRMRVRKNMFCASGIENKGVCKGDSGGPAVSRNQVCGIVAFSIKCGVPGSSAAFTSVHAVRDFINGAMVKKSN